MDPSLSAWGIAFLVLLLPALNAVKLVLGAVDVVLTVQFVLGTDSSRHNGQVLHHDSWAFTHQLAAENAIDTDTTVIAEADRLGPRVALLKEHVLEVRLHEAVFDWVAIVVKCLHHVLAPALVQL